jgi:putative SOS response-associated peptidase YedK
MCGRYLLDAQPDLLRRAFGLGGEEPPDLAPRYNIAPTQRVPIVRAGEDGRRETVVARWGLIPPWAKDPAIGARLINARAETIEEKPSFRAPFRAKRRCVVPASGFYEWQRPAEGPKRPHVIRRKDGGPVGFAGLWEPWTDPGTGETVATFTIITTAANELAAEVHDRMPVILAPEDYGTWLEAPAPIAADLLRPCPAAWLEAVPVSDRVNSPRNDDPSLAEPSA